MTMTEATYRRHAIYSQRACNVAGVLNSVAERAAVVEDLTADPVLRLFLEQVNFLVFRARLDAAIMMDLKGLDLGLADLIAMLSARRQILLDLPEWKTFGSAIFESDVVIKALTTLALDTFTMDYNEAYRRCDQYAETVEEVTA